MKREFNTSGPNDPTKHYTLMREDLIEQGKDLVYREKYFTIWAPRQTGKSTYFRLLADELEKEGYEVAHVNFENYADAPLSAFLSMLLYKLNFFWNTSFNSTNLPEIFEEISKTTNRKLVLIIDEVEGINSDYFNVFIHSIRQVYHSRKHHSLKSVIFVGIANITGVISDNASPFNIVDELSINYFTNEETKALLAQHETETGQFFAPKVKEQISKITANQPGLVNGFAYKLVQRCEGQQLITFEDYLKIEDWYLTEAIDKNVENIINKAKQHRKFVEKLLYVETKIAFTNRRPEIRTLYTNGIIEKDEQGNICFKVPLYKKSLYAAFYPYTNGEQKRIQRRLLVDDFLTEDHTLNFDKLIGNYKAYVQRRSFKYFREKDKNGNYVSIKEAALVYSFETYIQAFLQEAEGKSYLEAHAGLGRTDLLINLYEKEYIIEFKIYYSANQFTKGKKQLAYYCTKNDLKKGYYLVFIANDIPLPKTVKEQTETINGIAITTYLVIYDEEKDF